MQDPLAVALVMSRLSLMDVVRASQVCKVWREALLKPAEVKTHFDLSPFLQLRDPNTALRLLEARGKSALSVNLGYVRLAFPLTQFIPFLSANLRSLDVSAITSKKWITDEAVDALTKRCGACLTRLNFFGCWLLTDTSLKYIGSRAPLLFSLNIGSCSAITDEGLKQLATCSMLQDLSIWRLEVWFCMFR